MLKRNFGKDLKFSNIEEIIVFLNDLRNQQQKNSRCWKGKVKNIIDKKKEELVDGDSSENNKRTD